MAFARDSTTSRSASPVVGLWAHRWSDLAGRTGVGRYAIELSRALDELDGPLRYERRGGHESGRIGGSPALRRSWPPRRLLHASWLFFHAPRLEWVAQPVDLLHVLFPSFPVVTRMPLVVTIHDVFVLDHPEWYRTGERRVVATSIRRLAEQADRIITDSEHAAGRIVERLGVEHERITVVSPGVSPLPPDDGRRSPPPTAAPYVLAVGATTERKNLGVLVEAMSRLDGVDLVHVGPPGPASAAIESAAAAHSIEHRVHDLGRLPDEELAAILRGALVLAHPAVEEGYGFPPLEAMAAGTPALVARAGSLPEVVGAAATVLDPHDPDAWAKAIARLRDDPELRASRIKAGRAHVAERTWAAAASATSAVHEAVLRDHGLLPG